MNKLITFFASTLISAANLSSTLYAAENSIGFTDDGFSVCELQVALTQSLEDEKNKKAEKIASLLSKADNFTPQTPPHALDDKINAWSDELLNFVTQLDETISTVDPESVKAAILGAADNEDLIAHSRTTKGYIQLRFNSLGAYNHATNKLLQVIGWCQTKGLIDFQILAYNLIPANDSPSAMYNVFFQQGVHRVNEYLNQENK
jgi:hypothetical protein